MSASLRQKNLFTAEDYEKVFKAYTFIDFTAYDFDTLKQALINYIRTYYAEDFNDYIESSEFIAIVELIAYLGTSLAFRADINSRENFIDTAERRESIIRLAQMVNYVPKRNIAASGMFKVVAVETDQQLVDANGLELNNTTVFWNDPNNGDWFDQFIQICNAAFTPSSPFGRPTKSGTVGNIPTDLYQLNNILRLNVTYQTSVTVNGQQYPVDICNPDFVDNGYVFERHPDPLNAFHMVYRNDSLGVASANTGFFLYFKQGTLTNYDTAFDFPEPNRVYPIAIKNINQDDVYVQETDESGNVVVKWKNVPALAGENIIYNSIQLSERNIFDVISDTNDTVTIRFADGNFGNVPVGLYRFWIRTSANEYLVIRPADVQTLQINIPYLGSDNQEYTLRVLFKLEQTVSNAAPSETNEQIKLRAPEVFSTQSRMVNGSDYNVLPLVYGNQIAKLKALNRTYSGQSRYIDLNDPTGFHRDLIIFGQDGTLFRAEQNVRKQVMQTSTNVNNINGILIDTLQDVLRSKNAGVFFNDEYLSQFEDRVRVNPPGTGRSLLDLSTDETPIYWRASPAKSKNDTGYFTSSVAGNSPALQLINTLSQFNTNHSNYVPYGFIRDGSAVEFNTGATTLAVSVNDVQQYGIPTQLNSQFAYAGVGPVELGAEVKNLARATRLYPRMRTEFTSAEIDSIIAAVSTGTSFWLYYDLLKDTWGISIQYGSTVSPETAPFRYPDPKTTSGTKEIYSEWASSPSSGLVYVNIYQDAQAGVTSYDITARGMAYVFQSYKDARFYWGANEVVIDSTTGLAKGDVIEILPFVNTNSSVGNNSAVSSPPCNAYLTEPVKFSIAGAYLQNDGYLDTSKVEVDLIDENADGIPDNPGGFNAIVSRTDMVVFEYYSDELTGYQNSRPWLSRWDTTFAQPTSVVLGDINSLYVYFPTNTSYASVLSGVPFIANMQGLSRSQILDPSSVENPAFKYVQMDSADLLFTYSLPQVKTMPNTVSRSIEAALTEFFNSGDLMNNKLEILTNYFFNKSFFVSSLSTPAKGVFYRFELVDTDDVAQYPTGKKVEAVIDRYHFSRNGKTFTQNLNIPKSQQIPVHFKWNHYAPWDQIVDPAASNIIDMIVITYNYYNEMQVWKKTNGTIATLPVPPSTHELRAQYNAIEQYKMVSDSVVWNSGKFKILFGPQAEPELQAVFKVVKSPTADVSDSEIKVRVVEAIDAYFDIRNWDFGEKFFYTELAAYIHQRLSRIISSVVIVPANSSSQFGNLFEIVATPSEIFMSTATVANVQIINNLTEQTLRV